MSRFSVHSVHYQLAGRGGYVCYLSHPSPSPPTASSSQTYVFITLVVSPAFRVWTSCDLSYTPSQRFRWALGRGKWWFHVHEVDTHGFMSVRPIRRDYCAQCIRQWAITRETLKRKEWISRLSWSGCYHEIYPDKYYTPNKVTWRTGNWTQETVITIKKNNDRPKNPFASEY